MKHIHSIKEERVVMGWLLHDEGSPENAPYEPSAVEGHLAAMVASGMLTRQGHLTQKLLKQNHDLKLYVREYQQHMESKGTPVGLMY